MSPVDGYQHVFECLSMRLLCVPLFSWYFLAAVNYYQEPMNPVGEYQRLTP